MPLFTKCPFIRIFGLVLVDFDVEGLQILDSIQCNVIGWEKSALRLRMS